MRAKGGCNTLPWHALQIKHIIKLVCRVIDSVRDGRRREKTMRYQVSLPKSPVICALYRSENKIPTHRCWFPILKVNTVYGHVSLLKVLSKRRLVAFPDSAMLLAKFSN